MLFGKIDIERKIKYCQMLKLLMVYCVYITSSESAELLSDLPILSLE